MSESQDATPVVEVVVVSEFPIPLDEFCMGLSRRVRGVELIAVFHHLETAAGRMNDMAAAYQSRFDTVHARPAQ